jgi:GNAT superfamily N-acetyltransferase
VVYRAGSEPDLDACARTWKVAIDDYQRRLGQPATPTDLAPLRRLLVHTLATDPERFWVAEAIDDRGRREVVGFSSATVRDGLWFLAMLFVRPDLQGHGIGAALMDRAQSAAAASGAPVPGPDDPLGTGIHTWGMCTDAAQPISNAMYARRGMLPRLPVWRLFGEIRRWSALPELPSTLEAVPFERVVGERADGHRALAALVDTLDRELIGAAHAADHAFLRREARSGFLVGERGRVTDRPLGYAYGSAGGRLGPVAAADPSLHPLLLGVAMRQTPMLGPVAAWVPGTADRATRALLDAGLRLDGFPGLVCWSRPEHPFDRYLPISLALV